MNLTDQEMFYKCLMNNRVDGDVFPQPNMDCASYFNETEIQPFLSIYDLENINDVKNIMDSILTEENFAGIKEECIKTILQNIISYGHVGVAEAKKNKEVTVPEFIYNF